MQWQGIQKCIIRLLALVQRLKLLCISITRCQWYPIDLPKECCLVRILLVLCVRDMLLCVHNSVRIISDFVGVLDNNTIMIIVPLHSAGIAVLL